MRPDTMFIAIAAIVLSLSLGAVLTPTAYAAADPIEIRIGVSDKLAPSIQQTREKYPDACKQDEFFSPEWLRTTLEFFLICRAVRLGGVDATFTLVSFPNSARTRAELKKGTVMTMIDLPWGDFADDAALYKSSAVLPLGSFVKGIYTLPDHQALLNVRTLEELRKFTAVSSKTWLYDWAALERMKVRTIHVPRYDQMGAMVERGRADFFVGEFPGVGDLSQYVNGVRFIPVPGVKIVLPGSRHVAVSKWVPHSQEVFDAIQIGLEKLRERGLILKGYQTSGFFNPQVEDWKVLCCE